MDKHQLDLIANDEAEVRDPFRTSSIKAKLAWYAASRPIMHSFLRRKLLELSPRLAEDPVFNRVNLFLNGDGGMFKEYAYGLSNRMAPIRGSRVLVPGIGYARNLLQLAAFKPKEIVAFDLYEYSEIWEMMTKKLRDEFGVQITFYKGDFDVLPRENLGKFDHVISDAVLEHVPDMPGFAAGSRDFLKEDGIFYASFGPLWYGPCGDHASWGEDKLFDHILLSKEEYDKQLKENPTDIDDRDSCDTGFLIKEGLFSYLHAKQYLDEMDKAGFDIVDLYSKIQPLSLRLFRQHPEIAAALDARDEPSFDRFSGGLYIWARKNSKVQGQYQ